MSKLPLRFIPIGELLGDHEGAESLSLPSVLSAGGSENVTIDKHARLTSILGYTRKNTAAVASNTGAAATRLRGLWHYVNSALATPRIEIGIFDTGPGGSEYEWRQSTNGGATWTFVSNFGPNYIGKVPSFAQLGSTLVAAFGTGAIKTFDGTTLADADNTQLVAPTIVDGGAGSLLGTYRWKVVPRKSDGTRKFGSTFSARTTLTNRKATVTWTTDADATSYEVYRTSGAGEIAFQVGAVASGTLTFSDDVSDIRLIAGRMLQEYGEEPSVGLYFVFVHKERVFYVRTDTFPRRAYYSDPGLPYSIHLDSSFVDFTDAESFSDLAVGGIGNYEGMAVVFLERSVWTVSGTGQTQGAFIDFVRRRSNARVGAVSIRAVASVPRGSRFFDAQGTLAEISTNVLAYLTPYGDLRIFDGRHDAVIGYAKADTFARLSYGAREKAYCVSDTPRGEITWVFPADGDLEPNLAVTWNYKFGTMVDRPAWRFFAHAIEAETAQDSSVLLAGEGTRATGGFCYLLWDGITDPASTALTVRVTSKSLYGVGNALRGDGMSTAALMQYQKRWRWIEFLVFLSGPVTFTLEWWPGESDLDDQPYGRLTNVAVASSTLYDVNGVAIQDVAGNALTAPILRGIIRAKLKTTVVGKDRYLHSRGMRLRLSSTSTTATWSLAGMLVAYQLLPGLKRTFIR